MRGPKQVGDYYDQQVGLAQASGAGLIWFMGGDHLSPALSNVDSFALNSTRWREATSLRVIGLARHLNLSIGGRALDLGCGIGGPGRDIEQLTGATIYGVSISIQQLRNLRRLSLRARSAYREVVNADMEALPFRDCCFNSAFSINSIYHLNRTDRVIAETYRVLRSGGRFGIDDWFTTQSTSTPKLEALRHHWSTGDKGFHEFNSFVATMRGVGFRVVDIADFTIEAGAFLSEKRFGAVFNRQVAPILIRAFPQLYQYPGYELAHAELAVAQLREAILYMGKLYRNGDAVYRQIIAEKP